jgi:hypothetical protein
MGNKKELNQVSIVNETDFYESLRIKINDLKVAED